MNNRSYYVETSTSNVPCNQEDLPKREIEVAVFVTLSKTIKLTVNDYEIKEITDKAGKHLNWDCSNCNLHKAVEDQIVLPQNLAEFTERMFDYDLDLKAAKMPRYLREAITDCKDWIVDDMECILEQ